MTKREFLGWAAFSMAAVVAYRAVSAAEPIRILGERRQPIPSPAPPRTRCPELERLMAQVRVCQARAHGSLRVLWLHGADAQPRLAVETLDEGLARDVLVIRERGETTVNTLVADNRGKTPVLLLAGEVVLGGKQNRVVADDLLLPPLSGPLEIPVYCVEQGRWVERGSKEFGARGTFVAPAPRGRAGRARRAQRGVGRGLALRRWHPCAITDG